MKDTIPLDEKMTSQELIAAIEKNNEVLLQGFDQRLQVFGKDLKRHVDNKFIGVENDLKLIKKHLGIQE